MAKMEEETQRIYKTRQRAEILEYMAEKEGSHVTANDVRDHFREQGINMGTATIYRNLDRMVSEGVITKYELGQNMPACFEYIGSNSHCADGACYHCKCLKCGRLIHLNGAEFDRLQKALLKNYGFMVDTKHTVFQGLCEFCREPERIKPERAYGKRKA